MTNNECLTQMEADCRAMVNGLNEAQEYRAANQAQSLLMGIGQLYNMLKELPSEPLKLKLG